MSYLPLVTSRRVRVDQILVDGEDRHRACILSTRPIPKNTILWELGGILSIDKVPSGTVSSVSSRLMTGPVRFANHSCRPNAMASVFPNNICRLMTLFASCMPSPPSQPMLSRHWRTLDPIQRSPSTTVRVIGKPTHVVATHVRLHPQYSAPTGHWSQVTPSPWPPNLSIII